MKIHRVEQQSVDWQILRSGKITASEMDSLVTPLGKVKTGAGPTSYLHKKVSEAWLGGPIASLNVFDAEQGVILEQFARPAFTLETNMDVSQVGFITTDDGRCGASPDGIIDGKFGLEIKCPRIETHVGYILERVLPPDYVLQVQGSLWVTGFSKWYFFSFCRRMPPLILEIEPDPIIQKAIGIAVDEFLERFDESLEKLTKLNGGIRPEARAKFQQPKPAFISTDPT